jgi:Response regulator containing CheY-like receiver, AAA-type ATPase, and DNA-binding domains
MYTVLVVDDEAKLLEVLSLALENMGHMVLTAESAEEALEILGTRDVHLVLSDLRLPRLSGRDLLEKVRVLKPGLPVVIMTAYASLKDAVELIKEGAFDYTVKPFDLNNLEATVTSGLRFYALGEENRQLRSDLQQGIGPRQFIGKSTAFLALLESIRAVGSSNANVLITGESGTGKELAARAIHYDSSRASGPLVIINCAAIPDTLLESELFGHVKGAYTGAATSQPGRFVQADSGTIFLDEIGDMSLPLQAKILRCIQEKVVEPVGAGKPRKVDVRIIAATNQDLPAAIAEGRFRQDLYYRLNVYPIVMPPLRERQEDIPLLARHFAERFGSEMSGIPVVFLPEALDAMQAHSWPGNIRELENCVERLSITSAGRTIGSADLEDCGIRSARETAETAISPACADAAYFPLDLDRQLEDVERGLILQALEQTGGVQVKAAELLNISERSIWHRIKKLGINILHKKNIS